MNTGTCLCTSVTWKVTAPPEKTYHCHCQMCRKAHGAAFGTYFFVPWHRFFWTSRLGSLRDYSSSRALTRTFCGTCGSLVPNTDSDGTFYFVPAGSHDSGAGADCHIFVASKAPWFEITDDLTCHDGFPPEENQPSFHRDPLPPPPEDVVRGSCLCGTVKFEVTEKFSQIHHCHCTRCRRARAAAFTTNGFTSDKGVTILQGQEHMQQYKLPDAKYFTHVFCDICSSGLPRIDPERQLAVTPLGALDDDPMATADDHIFVADKAPWFSITDTLPAFQQYPE